MPEGDTYVAAARRVAPVLVGATIEAVEGSAPAVRRRSAQLLDRVVTDVRTAGKNLLFELDSGLVIRIHLGMSGSVRTAPPGNRRGAGGGVRLGLSTDKGTVAIVGAPRVDVERRAVIQRTLDRLGPDLLDDDFDWERFEQRAARYPVERTVADFLLDQRVAAGVGNEYKSEVLFLEGIAPQHTMSEVDGTVRRRLAQRARRLMRPNAGRFNRATRGLPDGSLWVYGRSGEPCRRCRTAIMDDWLGTPPRITYWCPTCQA